jgi:hypothetical protein
MIMYKLAVTQLLWNKGITFTLHPPPLWADALGRLPQYAADV